jgi:hypothetical protein
MSFEKFYNDLIKNKYSYELSKHFYCSDEKKVKIPKDALKEKGKWIVDVISDEENYFFFLNSLTYNFNSKGLRLVNGTEDLLEYNGPEKDVRIVISRVEYKKSNPMEDKIKMLQDQIDELKKQVIL